MGEATAIAWTDHTFSPWWGCERVSPACNHCYAETFSKRVGRDVWGKNAPRQVVSDAQWRQPVRWDRRAAGVGRTALVFCGSMCDVFEDRPDLDLPRSRLWTVMAVTPHLVWQLLTKRPQHVLDMVPASWALTWPSNVWVGTTVEDQQRAEERIPHLLDVPAPVRFLSCEPLLGPVVLPALLPEHRLCGPAPTEVASSRVLAAIVRAAARQYGCWRGIDWVICGGESGPGHRPLNLDHARSLRDQCDAAGVPFFFKQVGGRTPTAGGDELDGRRWHQFPPEARR